jgi:hypothetical protein
MAIWRCLLCVVIDEFLRRQSRDHVTLIAPKYHNWNSLAVSVRIAPGIRVAESSAKPRIVEGCNNAGFFLKEPIKRYLQRVGKRVKDFTGMDRALAHEQRLWTQKFHST